MTFDFLKQISPKVYERYLTLERNIKSASNSFYDSYLDLQEELLRYIVASFEIEIITRRSFGELLRLDEIKNIFFEKLRLNKHTYEKMLDYTLKVNSHKHRGEKKIELETALKYITIFYEVSSAYAKYAEIYYEGLDIGYFSRLFNCLEKENEELKRQLEDYKELLEESSLNYEEKEKYRLLLSYSEINNASIEEQNRELRKRLEELNSLKNHIDYRFDRIDERLNRIEYGGKTAESVENKLTTAEQILTFSKKEYIFLGTENEFSIWKKALCISFLVIFTIGILSSYYATKFFNLYSTFTLFENIWLLLTIYITVYIIKSKRFYDIEAYKKSTMERIYCDKYGVPRKKVLKAKYIVFFVLSLISSVAHIFMSTYDKKSNIEYAGVCCVFEVLFIILTIAFQIAVRVYFSNYFLVLHTVKNKNGEIEQYIDDGITGKLIPYKPKIQ